MVTVAWDTSNLKVSYSGGKVCTSCCFASCDPFPENICMEIEGIVLCGEINCCGDACNPSEIADDPNTNWSGAFTADGSVRSWVFENNDWLYVVAIRKLDCRVSINVTHTILPWRCFRNDAFIFGEAAANAYEEENCGDGDCEVFGLIVGYGGTAEVRQEGWCA